MAALKLIVQSPAPMVFVVGDQIRIIYATEALQGAPGISAYGSYLKTTSDDPPMSEADWIALTVLVQNAADGDMIQRVGGSWISRTLAQIKAALGLKSAAYTESSAYAAASHTHAMADIGGVLELPVNPEIAAPISPFDNFDIHTVIIPHGNASSQEILAPDVPVTMESNPTVFAGPFWVHNRDVFAAIVFGVTLPPDHTAFIRCKPWPGTWAVTVIPSTSGTMATTADVTAATAGLLDFKSDTDCSTNPNYPSASKGDGYYVSVAGKIGGASGKVVDAGDFVVAKADNAGGTEASVGTSWFVLQRKRPVVVTTLAAYLALSVDEQTNGTWYVIPK